jgi:tRNA(adenine34) deaminase
MMRRALELAGEAARLGEVPVGAVVYGSLSDAPAAAGGILASSPGPIPPTHPLPGQIIAEGFNRREIDADPSAHAEFLAIRDAARALGDWRLTGCSLAVTLEPCPMCAGLIVNARVDRVVFATRDPKAGAVVSLYTLLADPRLNHRPRVIEGILADEAGEQLRAFFRRLRAKPGGEPGPGAPAT